MSHHGNANTTTTYLPLHQHIQKKRDHPPKKTAKSRIPLLIGGSTLCENEIQKFSLHCQRSYLQDQDHVRIQPIRSRKQRDLLVPTQPQLRPPKKNENSDSNQLSRKS
uniref:Uncharacterized protein n=1 Tax=Cacopsylla melanoneura TaxID=428564 RepID=A0A8D9EAF8_9HEMI